jgi:prepilin-type processing-associated H-X9-DG protein
LIRWTGDLHGFKGNLLYADGHVDELNSLRPAQNQNAGGALFLPSTRQPGAAAASPGNVGLAMAQNSPTGGVRSNPSPTNGSADAGRQTPATNLTQSWPNVSASSPSAVTRLALPGQDSPDNTKLAKPETNPPVVATQGSPSRTTQDDGGSPFMRWFADMAQQIMDWAKWLLWLLLLLLLIAMVALRLRQHARRKNK